MEYVCPHCKNPIYDDDALLCHFCGESLMRAGEGMLGKMKYTPAKLLPLVIILLMLISFLLIALR